MRQTANPTKPQIESSCRELQTKWPEPKVHAVDAPEYALSQAVVRRWMMDAAKCNKEWSAFLASLRTVLKIWAHLTGKVVDASGGDATWIAESLGVNEDWLRDTLRDRITPQLQPLLLQPRSSAKALLALESLHESLLLLQSALAQDGGNHVG